MTNKERAAKAEACINFIYNEDTKEIGIQDLMADLMHLTMVHNLDWDGLITQAHVHFMAELREGE